MPLQSSGNFLKVLTMVEAQALYITQTLAKIEIVRFTPMNNPHGFRAETKTWRKNIPGTTLEQFFRKK